MFLPQSNVFIVVKLQSSSWCNFFHTAVNPFRLGPDIQSIKRRYWSKDETHHSRRQNVWKLTFHMRHW
jgi:hypothetical protein